MRVLLPAGDIAVHLRQLIVRYDTHHHNAIVRSAINRHNFAEGSQVPKYKGPLTISQTDAARIVTAMFEDFIAVRSRWSSQAAYDVNTELVLAEVFTDPALHGRHWHMALSHFHTHVLESVYETVWAVMERFMPQPTWHVYYLRSIPRGLILEKGEDYRILDWENRVASGEWPDPTGKVTLSPALSASEDFDDVNHATLGDKHFTTEEFQRSMEKLLDELSHQRGVIHPGHGVPKRDRGDIQVLVNPELHEIPDALVFEIPVFKPFDLDTLPGGSLRLRDMVGDTGVIDVKTPPRTTRRR